MKEKIVNYYIQLEKSKTTTTITKRKEEKNANEK